MNVYDALVAERIASGRLLVDALSHAPADPDELVRILRWQERLEARLQRYRRWSHDADLVFDLKELRWHQPDQPPAQHDRHPCRLCLLAHRPGSMPRPIQAVG